MMLDIARSGVIVAGREHSWSALARFLADFQAANPDTTRIEQLGERAARLRFPWAEAETLIREVCWWGGYSGIAGRVLKNNSRDSIRSAFKAANDAMSRERPLPHEALSAINRLHGLGTPSFASKHLRLVWPHKCVVLDSVLSAHLHIPFTLQGYEALCEFCEAAAIQANRAKSRGWRPADIESAIFFAVRST